MMRWGFVYIVHVERAMFLLLVCLGCSLSANLPATPAGERISKTRRLADHKLHVHTCANYNAMHTIKLHMTDNYSYQRVFWLLFTEFCESFDECGIDSPLEIVLGQLTMIEWFCLGCIHAKQQQQKYSQHMLGYSLSPYC